MSSTTARPVGKNYKWVVILTPVNFSYPLFALIILLDGIGMGMFMAPNTTAVMNSLPEQHRGAGSGMRSTLFNVGAPLSTAVIFSLMTAGLNTSVPAVLYNGLHPTRCAGPDCAAGVPCAAGGLSFRRLFRQ